MPLCPHVLPCLARASPLPLLPHASPVPLMSHLQVDLRNLIRLVLPGVTEAQTVYIKVRRTSKTLSACTVAAIISTVGNRELS